MGYALFTARKMSLQAKVNQYNLQLMKLSNQETQLANQSALRQKATNAVDSAQNAGAFAASLVGGSIGTLIGGVANFAIDSIQNKSQEAYQTELAAKQQQIDTEKQRLTTLLNAASNELQQVEKAEGEAIKNSTPSYVG